VFIRSGLLLPNPTSAEGLVACPVPLIRCELDVIMRVIARLLLRRECRSGWVVRTMSVAFWNREPCQVKQNWIRWCPAMLAGEDRALFCRCRSNAVSSLCIVSSQPDVELSSSLGRLGQRSAVRMMLGKLRGPNMVENGDA